MPQNKILLHQSHVFIYIRGREVIILLNNLLITITIGFIWTSDRNANIRGLFSGQGC